jgi:hypothetical protein
VFSQPSRYHGASRRATSTTSTLTKEIKEPVWRCGPAGRAWPGRTYPGKKIVGKSVGGAILP